MNTNKALYHTKTQEEFDWLMQELEKEGCNWEGERKPTEFDVFDTNASGFHIFVDNKKITYGIWENYRIFHKGREYVKVSDIMTK